MAKRLEEEDDLFIRYNLACYLASIGDIKQAEQELHLVLEQDESGTSFMRWQKETKIFVCYVLSK
ncbi:hypothetical protein OC195_17915 [Priestia flexa]|nr:hypothetical protein OC195_17915 [Priestia flexa]